MNDLDDNDFDILLLDYTRLYYYIIIAVMS